MQWSLFSVKCFIITCWPALFWNKVILTGAPNTRLFLDSFILLLIALALIIARDQFEGTFVTIIRSLRLTFTFPVNNLKIGTFAVLYFDFWIFCCLDKVVVQSNSYQSSSWKLEANLTDDQHSFYAWNPLGWDFFCLFGMQLLLSNRRRR